MKSIQNQPFETQFVVSVFLVMTHTNKTFQYDINSMERNFFKIISTIKVASTWLSTDYSRVYLGQFSVSCMRNTAVFEQSKDQFRAV